MELVPDSEPLLELLIAYAMQVLIYAFVQLVAYISKFPVGGDDRDYGEMTGVASAFRGWLCEYCFYVAHSVCCCRSTLVECNANVI